MFTDFSSHVVQCGDVAIHVRVAGEGAPLLLIHGYPQTSAMWHKVAPELSKHYRVICPDLRGYGASDKPPGDKDHYNYSKRVMAEDMITVMDSFDYDQFYVGSHDRGSRVTHRLCLDYPARIIKAAMLDIIPTTTLYDTATLDVSKNYFHWYFLAQESDLPEAMINAAPLPFLHWALAGRVGGLDGVDREALEEYEKYFVDPAVVHATTEDYRAAATIDLEHDEADKHKKVQCPLLVLWGELGPMGSLYDVLETWRDKANNVGGKGLPCGHYPAEEVPEEVTQIFLEFFVEP